MINGAEKIGVGCITYNREHLLQKLFESITSFELHDVIDEIIIVNDGKPLEKDYELINVSVIENETNLGVGKTKNKALKHLLSKGCEHLFLIEDDIYIKDPQVFAKYIETSKESGIQHFNYSQHGRMNKTYGWGADSPVPNPKMIVKYDKTSVALYPHCVGAFSYYTRKCIHDVGWIDEHYYNACEHVDHTYQIIKQGYHPPFWFFADIVHSDTYLGDEEWSIEKSTISSRPNHQQMMVIADKLFICKHGHLPVQTPLASEEEVCKYLKEIRKDYGV